MGANGDKEAKTQDKRFAVDSTELAKEENAKLQRQNALGVENLSQSNQKRFVPEQKFPRWQQESNVASEQEDVFQEKERELAQLSKKNANSEEKLLQKFQEENVSWEKHQRTAREDFVANGKEFALERNAKTQERDANLLVNHNAFWKETDANGQRDQQMLHKDVAAELSTNVMERNAKSLLKDVDLLDSNWLITGFTDANGQNLENHPEERNAVDT
jgi:hypothetical protein